MNCSAKWDTYIGEYDIYVEQIIVFDKCYNLLITLTQDEKERIKRDTLLARTTETVDRVIRASI